MWRRLIYHPEIINDQAITWRNDRALPIAVVAVV
jgi:hypothetical protein